MLRLTADQSWYGTVLLFAPRWPIWAPLLALVPAAALWRRRTLWVQAAALVIALGPVSDLCLPWRTVVNDDQAAFHLRVLTCNLHDHSVNLDVLRRCIIASEADVVVLQSFSGHYGDVVSPPKDWHLRRAGQLLLASRYPILETKGCMERCFLSNNSAAADFSIETPAGVVHVFAVHLASPRDGLQAIRDRQDGAPGMIEKNTEQRREQWQALWNHVAEVNGPIIIAGDCNLPVDSAIYREHPPQFRNAFSEAGFGFGNTFFSRRVGVRIDQIIFGPGWQCQRCWVGPDLTSPHRPVIAELDWTGKGE
jgi:endonuclease/exonuclease/phosphatase (EEP) superfamily protein YafD